MKLSGVTGARRYFVRAEEITGLDKKTTAQKEVYGLHSDIQTIDLGTHTLFIAFVTDMDVLSPAPSCTYEYYQSNIKPKPQPTKKKGFVCKVCGYVYEGDELPADFICPLCKHGAEDFEPIG